MNKKAFALLKNLIICAKNKKRENLIADKKEKTSSFPFLTGFTLIELLIYVAVFTITVGLITGIFITLTKVSQKESASVEVTNQLNFIMQTISRLTKESSAIIVNGTSTDVSNDGAIGIAYPRLILRMKDSAEGASDRDPIIIWNDGGVIKESEGSGANKKTNILTNSKVITDNLQFTKFTQYPGHDTVSINIQLSYNSSNPSSQFTKTLQSAIARVSAATFDSDVLPGSSYTYNLGQNGSPWQNIYMKAGTAASPSYTFTGNPTLGIFSPSTDVLGFSTAGTEKMRIDSIGNVGIGTTGPNAKLQILGGDVAVSTQGNGLILRATNGANCYRLTVSNTGALATSSAACP